MMYVLAAAAASGLFVAAGWRSRHRLTAVQGWSGLTSDTLWHEPEIDTDSPALLSDAGAAIRLVMKRLAPVMANRSVQAEIASPSGLLVRMSSVALADLLEEFLAAAIHNAPASRILMSAASGGDRIDVSITDDVPWADPCIRQATVRGLARRVALRGGELGIDVRPGEGTTMTLRLTAAAHNRPVRPGAAIIGD